MLCLDGTCECSECVFLILLAKSLSMQDAYQRSVISTVSSRDAFSGASVQDEQQRSRISSVIQSFLAKYCICVGRASKEQDFASVCLERRRLECFPFRFISQLLFGLGATGEDAVHVCRVLLVEYCVCFERVSKGQNLVPVCFQSIQRGCSGRGWKQYSSCPFSGALCAFVEKH